MRAGGGTGAAAGEETEVDDGFERRQVPEAAEAETESRRCCKLRSKERTR